MSNSTTFDLAEAAEESGNYAEAFKYWTLVIEGDPKNARAWLGKGLAAGRQSTLARNRLGETNAAFERVLEMGGADPSLLLNMGQAGLSLAGDLHKLASDHCHKFRQYTDTRGMSFTSSMEWRAKDATRNRELQQEYASHARAALALILVSVRALLQVTGGSAPSEAAAALRNAGIKSIELACQYVQLIQQAQGLFEYSGMVDEVASVQKKVLGALPDDSEFKRAQLERIRVAEDLAKRHMEWRKDRKRIGWLVWNWTGWLVWIFALNARVGEGLSALIFFGYVISIGLYFRYKATFIKQGTSA